MRIEYIKANPTENKTILVQTSVKRVEQARIATLLLKNDTDAEQVGFIETAERNTAFMRLQMMGGEFCGNAAISAAALLAKREGIEPMQTRKILLEVSGAAELVECGVFFDGKSYIGTVDMPLPNKVEELMLEYKGKEYSFFAVFFPGIVHLVFSKEGLPNDSDFAEKALKHWSKAIEEEAIGLIGFDEERKEIKPLVYVKSTDSLYWERGCGTGTAAAGVYMSYKRRESVVIPVKQPGGIITAETVFEKGILNELKITGGVFFEEQGFVDIKL